jgi:hypothetical protein
LINSKARLIRIFFENVASVFKRYSYQPGFRINKFSLNKSEKPPMDKGVYKINCDNNEGCNKIYVGFVTRSFSTRFKEHVAQHQKNSTSKVAQHLKENPFTFN